MLNKSIVARLVARPGKEEEVADFLKGALALAQGEGFMPVWFALRVGADVFYIFDAFTTDADRQKHLAGQIAGALMARASELLAEPPRIEQADVLAAKMP